MVAGWVRFYKEHRAILESDTIHLWRADGSDQLVSLDGQGRAAVEVCVPPRGRAWYTVTAVGC